MTDTIEIAMEPMPLYAGDGVNVYIRKGREFAKSVVMEAVKEGHYVEPSFCLSSEMAQQLCDNLWRIGFRPSRAQDASPVIEAKQQHIDDLRGVLRKAGRIE